MEILSAAIQLFMAMLLAPFRLLARLFGRGERAPRNAIEAYARPGPHAAGAVTLKLVDRNRRTERNWWYRGRSERKLTTEVWYPAAGKPGQERRSAPLDRSGAPYPLIIFAHGLSGVRRQSKSYCRHLAGRGYVVASPDFPLSKFTAPGGATVAAVLEQPRDVTFVIDSLLKMSADSGDKLAGGIDESSIGMSGHSLGGLTSLLTAYGAWRDSRVKAIVPIAAPGWFVPPRISHGMHVPSMSIGGTKDLIVNPASIRAGYEASSAPKWYIDIAGAEHMRFADVSFDDRVIRWLFGWMARVDRAKEPVERVMAATGADMAVWEHPVDTSSGKRISPNRQRELMRGYAAPFFDAHLKDDAEASSLLARLDGITPEVRVESEGIRVAVA